MKKLKSHNELPDGYKLSYRLDLKNNLKLQVILNLLSFLFLIPFIIAIGIFDVSLELGLEILLLLPLYIIIIILHELIHALMFKLGTKEKVSFGLTWYAACAGAKGIFFYKRHYMLIGIMPAVIINVVLFILCFFTNGVSFSIIFIVLFMHLAGCIGDFYVFFKLIKYKNNTLIEDTGLIMSIYTSEL